MTRPLHGGAGSGRGAGDALVTRSGRLGTVEHRTDDRGGAFARFTLEATGFLVPCVAFDPRLLSILAEATRGDMVWVKGRIEAQALPLDQGDAAPRRTWRTLVARALSLPGTTRRPSGLLPPHAA